MCLDHCPPACSRHACLPAIALCAGLRQRVEQHLGGALDEEPTVHLVRDVAPRKIMCCVTFRVPASIAFAAAAAAANGDDDGTAKRQKVT